MYKRISENDIMALSAPITDDEIKMAIFAIGSDKAPGPDGFNAFFFKENWEVVGNDVVDAVQYFFRCSYLPRQWN